jgi:nitroreductase
VDAKQAIITRRSVRSFIKRSVPPDLIAEILDSGSKAPSASNGRPWEFIIVKDQKVKDKIGYLGARSLYERKKRKLKQALKQAKEKFAMIAEAPVYIVVACDTKKSPIFWVHDGSAATQNILLATHALGLGAVWLGAPVALAKHQNEIKKMLKLPRHVKIASIVALGYPKIMPGPRAISDVKEKVHFERW